MSVKTRRAATMKLGPEMEVEVEVEVEVEMEVELKVVD